jgi:hypothetical protein
MFVRVRDAEAGANAASRRSRASRLCVKRDHPVLKPGARSRVAIKHSRIVSGNHMLACGGESLEQVITLEHPRHVVDDRVYAAFFEMVVQVGASAASTTKPRRVLPARTENRGKGRLGER